MTWLVAQVLLGYWLKSMAHAYWQRFQRLHGKGRPKGLPLRSVGTGLAAGQKGEGATSKAS